MRMKSLRFSLVFAVVVALLASASFTTAFGQIGTTEPQTVTLLSRAKYQDYDKATFSFKHGVRDDPGALITKNDWDLLYGNLTFNHDSDWFTVAMASDDRSQIKDLGEMTWAEVSNVPLLPPCPETNERCTMLRLARNAEGKIVSDVNGHTAKAFVHHMYVAHIKDRRSDFYVMFRVEELQPNDSCTISWKLVPSPEE